MDFHPKKAKWWFFQERLFYRLSDRDDPYYPEAALQLLDSSSKDARNRGIIALLRMPGSQVTGSLISYLKKAQHTEIPAILAKLAESGETHLTVPFALSYIISDDADTRKAAIFLLMKAGHPSVCRTLVTLLADPDMSIRYAALRALETCSDGTISPILVNLLSDRDPRMRVAAIRALTKAGSGSSYGEIVTLLRDPNPAVRAAVISSLSEMNPDSGTAAVISPFTQDPSWMVRIAAVGALSRVGREEDIPALEQVMKDDPAYDGEGVPIRELARNARERIAAKAGNVVNGD